MHGEYLNGIIVRPLRNGDTAVIQAVFDALGPTSRLLRWGDAKNTLKPAELEVLARVDGEHHVLVAWDGRCPIGIGRLVRDGDRAEVAFEVADAWQGKGIGSALADRLAADARAAGITRFDADVRADNVRSPALIRRLQTAA